MTKLTIANVRKELRVLGIVLTRTDCEFRVNYARGSEATAYYTNDLDDAFGTGKLMAGSARALVFSTLDEVLAFSGKIDDATSAISAFLRRPGTTIEIARKVVDFVNFRRSVEG
jgi:hypothetical protein